MKVRIKPVLFLRMLNESPTWRAFAQGRDLTGLSAFYEKSALCPGFSIGEGVSYLEVDFDNPHVQKILDLEPESGDPPPKKVPIMSPRDQAWKELVKRFADGRPICNCGNAYATYCPGDAAPPEERTCAGCANTPQGHTFCGAGCSGSQIITRNEIAARVLSLLDKESTNYAR